MARSGFELQNARPPAGVRQPTSPAPTAKTTANAHCRSIATTHLPAPGQVLRVAPAFRLLSPVPMRPQIPRSLTELIVAESKTAIGQIAAGSVCRAAAIASCDAAAPHPIDSRISGL